MQNEITSSDPLLASVISCHRTSWLQSCKWHATETRQNLLHRLLQRSCTNILCKWKCTVPNRVLSCCMLYSFGVHPDLTGIEHELSTSHWFIICFLILKIKSTISRILRAFCMSSYTLLLLHRGIQLLSRDKNVVHVFIPRSTFFLFTVHRPVQFSSRLCNSLWLKGLENLM
jgi:hypothetical protein